MHVINVAANANTVQRFMDWRVNCMALYGHDYGVSKIYIHTYILYTYRDVYDSYRTTYYAYRDPDYDIIVKTSSSH